MHAREILIGKLSLLEDALDEVKAVLNLEIKRTVTGTLVQLGMQARERFFDVVTTDVIDDDSESVRPCYSCRRFVGLN